jgi:hypothetical protein
MTAPVITDEEIKTFEEDGVVCLRQRFEPHWLESLAEGFEKNLAAPGPNSSQLTPEGNIALDADEILHRRRCCTFAFAYREVTRGRLQGYVLGSKGIALRNGFEIVYEKEVYVWDRQ